MNFITKINFAFVCLFIISTTTYTEAAIYSVQTLQFEQVQIEEEDFIKFKVCENTCKYLGEFQSYPIKLVKKQQLIENLQFGAATAASPAVAVTSFIAGWILDMATHPVMPGPLIGILAPALVFAYVPATNPAEQYRQRKVISDKYMQADLHELTDGEFAKVIKSLTRVIKKLDKKMKANELSSKILKNFSPSVL